MVTCLGTTKSLMSDVSFKQLRLYNIEPWIGGLGSEGHL